MHQELDHTTVEHQAQNIPPLLSSVLVTGTFNHHQMIINGFLQVVILVHKTVNAHQEQPVELVSTLVMQTYFKRLVVL